MFYTLFLPCDHLEEPVSLFGYQWNKQYIQSLKLQIYLKELQY